MRALIRAAFRHGGPVAIRHGKAIDDGLAAAAGGAPEPSAAVDPGRWAAEPMPGGVLVIGAGDLLGCAAEVAARLRADGVPAGLANARWIEPLDERLPRWAAEHRLVAVIEDHWSRGGLGSAVRERLAEAGIDTPVRVYAVPHGYLPHGAVPALRQACGLDPGSVHRDLAARWRRLTGLADERGGPGADGVREPAGPGARAIVS
jgi:1-deoxy-D-xylulose-5-phosphate synthase